MSYKAVLFGSIGTLAETSDLQRDAFNEAFKIKYSKNQKADFYNNFN